MDVCVCVCVCVCVFLPLPYWEPHPHLIPPSGCALSAILRPQRGSGQGLWSQTDLGLSTDLVTFCKLFALCLILICKMEILMVNIY